MDINSYTIEDFVCDESFRSYCHGNDTAAVQFWQKWIQQNPEKMDLVREAQQLISILSARQGNVQEQLHQLKDGITRFELLKTSLADIPVKPAPILRWKRLTAAAAALLLIITAVWLLKPNKTPNPKPSITQTLTSGSEPRKTVVLPDGSVVTLHSNSTLTLSEGFGRTSRELTLSGEALFDVVHSGQHPLIVHTSSVDVEVLGTLFNLNAYPQSGYTETSLFRGKIAVSLKDHPDQKMILTPSQKSVVFTNANNLPRPAADSALKKVALSVDPVNHKAKEIAWVRSRIKIEDEPLETIAGRLQAWYGIPIVFTDNETKGYRYSGTFESETVVKALEALQLSYPFNFRVEKDTILIGK